MSLNEQEDEQKKLEQDLAWLNEVLAQDGVLSITDDMNEEPTPVTYWEGPTTSWGSPAAQAGQANSSTQPQDVEEVSSSTAESIQEDCGSQLDHPDTIYWRERFLACSREMECALSENRRLSTRVKNLQREINALKCKLEKSKVGPSSP